MYQGGHICVRQEGWAMPAAQRGSGGPPRGPMDPHFGAIPCGSQISIIVKDSEYSNV